MAEEQDPLQGNTGGTKQRAEELRQINLEGARAKTTLEGINGVFKDLGKNSSVFTEEVQKGLKGAISTSSEIAAQIRNFSKNYKENIKLGKDLAGATVNMLKDSKSRKAFEDQVLRAQNEQAAVLADITNLRQQEADLSLAIEEAALAADEAIKAQKDAQQQLNNVQAAYGGMLKENSAENQAAAAARQAAFLLGNDIADQEGLINASLEKRALLSKQQADLETQVLVAKAKGDDDTVAALQEAIAQKSEEIKLQNELVDAGRSAIEGLVELQKEQQEIEEYNLKQVENAQKLVGEAEKVLKTKKEEAEAAKAAAEITGDQYTATVVLREEQEKAAKAIKQGLDNAEGLSEEIEKINKATPAFIEAFEKFGDATSSIPIIGDAVRFMTGGIADASKKFKELKAEGKGAGEAIAKAFGGFGFAGLTAALTSFIALAVKGAMKSSKAIVTLNKSVAGSMVDMQAQMSRTAAAAGKFKVPLEEAAGTIAGLNESLGTSLDFTAETTNQAIKLANKYEVSGQAVAHLVKLSASNKDTLTETVDAVTGGVAKFNALNSVSISTKAVFEDIGSASATTLRNLGKSPDAIVRAAAAARSLGMSMDDINDAARSTLDFQDSMAAEMEAELMLGKELNLDRLRAAAATGDTATQAEEMKRLVMENADAIGNNVLAQEKFAATLGISREQYNEMLKTNDALSVLEGKSGAAQQANDEARKMSQEEIAKSVADTTGKLTDLNSKIEKFQENMATGALGFAQGIIDGFDDGFFAGISNIGSMMWDEISKAWEQGFDYFKSGTNVGKFLGVLGIGGAGVITLKAGSSLLGGFGKLFGLGGGKPTGAANDPIYTRSDGAGGLVDSLTRTLRPRNVRGMNLTKKLSNLFGGKKTIVGKQLRNLAAMFGKRSSMFKQVFNGLSKTFTSGGSKLFSGLSSTFKAGGPKILSGITNTFSKIGPGVGKVAGPLLGKVLAPLELAMGGFKGYNQVANMTDEEKKEAGIRADMGKGEATALGVLTGGAERGSMFSETLGIEKGSAGDDAMGILGSAGRGAAVGAAIGSIIPGVGTAIGAAAGGIIGGASEAFKVFSDPNSQLRKKVGEGLDYMGDQLKKGWENAKEFGNTVKEKLGSAWSSLTEKAGNFKDALGEKLSNGFEFIKGKASDLKDAMGERVSSAFNGAKTMATDLFNGFKNLASNAFGSIKKKGAEVLNKLKDSKVGQVVSSTYDKIKEGASNVLSYIGFAKGGIVTKPTLAMIGEGGEKEAVVPLSKAETFGFGGGLGKLGKFLSPIAKTGIDVSKTLAQKIKGFAMIAAEKSATVAENFSDKVREGMDVLESATVDTIAELKKIAAESDRQHQKEIQELRNQTAALFQLATKKQTIRMDSYKVGESLVSRY